MIITLLSDFGLRDPYVAEMKGVILSILSIDPHAVLVDITHEVKKFDVNLEYLINPRFLSRFIRKTPHS